MLGCRGGPCATAAGEDEASDRPQGHNATQQTQARAHQDGILAILLLRVLSDCLVGLLQSCLLSLGVLPSLSERVLLL